MFKSKSQGNNMYIMKILITLLALTFLVNSCSVGAFAIPSDQNSTMLKSWNLSAPIFEKDNSFAISSTFSGSNVFYVDVNANKIGRLVPSTNTITEWEIPTNSSLPVAIDVDTSTRNVYFVEANANKIGRFVPSNEQFTEWVLPNKPATMDVDSAGSIYYIDKFGKSINRLS